MKFSARNRQYEVDQFGVIHQTDHKPFAYDQNYVACYDSSEYESKSQVLQAMRFGFAQGAHGRRIRSLLDYGYGNGAFMKFINGRVPFIYGYDLTGIRIDNTYILPEVVKSDTITFWDALEHVADLSFVKDLPCETIALSLPYCHFHTQGKDWFENNYHHLKPDEHLHHFNEHSLTAFMNSMGWKVVAVSDHEDKIRAGKNQGLQNILSMAFKRK